VEQILKHDSEGIELDEEGNVNKFEARNKDYVKFFRSWRPDVILCHDSFLLHELLHL